MNNGRKHSIDIRIPIDIVALLLSGFLLSGCASGLPPEIEKAPSGAPTLDAVQAAPVAFKGEKVRWGGAIVRVDNQADETRIEIVEKPLYQFGRPDDVDGSGGRFIATIQGFLDPALFSEDRLVTVFGTVDASVIGKIGEYNYTYPVVRVSHYHLWAPVRRQSYPRYRNDPWYDPWYDPWHRSWHGPWRRHGHRPFHDPFFPH